MSWSCRPCTCSTTPLCPWLSNISKLCQRNNPPNSFPMHPSFRCTPPSDSRQLLIPSWKELAYILQCAACTCPSNNCIVAACFLEKAGLVQSLAGYIPRWCSCRHSQSKSMLQCIMTRLMQYVFTDVKRFEGICMCTYRTGHCRPLATTRNTEKVTAISKYCQEIIVTRMLYSLATAQALKSKTYREPAAGSAVQLLVACVLQLQDS